MKLALAFLTHFIADFILQSRTMGQKKSSSLRWLGMHIAIIFVCFLPFGLKFAACNALIHAVIDGTIWNLYKLIAAANIRKEMRKEGFGTKPYPFYNNDEKYKAVFQIKAKYYKYWEDHWFYTTIGFDQLLHGLTIILLMEYL